MITKAYIRSFCCYFLLNILSGMSAAERSPNILMINVNDTNDFVGFLDSQYSDQSRTPHMDKLAKKGVNFTNAHCATPSCTPSRHALFYGVQPFNSGLYRYNFNIYEAMDTVKERYPNFVSLNQTLRTADYTTYGLGHVHGNLDNLIEAYHDIEWDVFHTVKYAKLSVVPEYDLQIKGKKTWKCGPSATPEEDYDAYRYATKAMEVLEEDHDKPFFLAVGFGEAHTPTIPPQKYFDLFDDFEMKPIIEDDFNDIPEVGWKLAKEGSDHKQISEVGQWEVLIRSYLATLSFVDAQVGRVLSALEESEYRDDTIVILWSDHGNNYGRKHKLAKFTLWDASTRVPFVIWDPRNPDRTGACRESVSLVDIYPTVLEMIGEPAIDHLDGVSLTPWLDNVDLPRDTPAITMMGRGNYGIRDRDWRYIRYLDGSEELYHTRIDQDEVRNLVADPRYAAVVDRLAAFVPANEAPMNKIGLEKMKFYDADLAEEEGRETL